jgi:hypothetical protein
MIITLALARSQQSYRHEAFLWHDASDFTAGIVPYDAVTLSPAVVEEAPRSIR